MIDPNTVLPVTPGASPEAVALLRFIHASAGRQTLSGQHCVPLLGSTRLSVVYRTTGKYPAVFGQDFGFAAPGDWDGINFRQRIIDEAIVRHRDGFIITLMWHAVRPIEDEPVTFEQSIQGKLTDSQWNDLLTPGTCIHEMWKTQVDVIAWHLKQLQYANVPVIWRPYHEMNGGWFWWGRRRGGNGYKKLYRQLYDRFTNFHALRNLLWAYNANEVGVGVDAYDVHFPGHDVVDILATDVYRNGFAQSDYESLTALAAGKPIALGEVGQPPSPAILQSQPGWAWFMCWHDPPPHDKGLPAYRETFASTRVVHHDALPWVQVRQPKIHWPVLG